MLKFSGETFSQAEIEVGLAFLIVPVIVFGFAIVFVIPFVHIITFVVVFNENWSNWSTHHQEIINGADLDGDGRIDYSEFAEMMVNNP